MENNQESSNINNASVAGENSAVIKKIERLGKDSMVLGILSTLVWLPFGPWAGPAGIYVMVLALPLIVVEIVCFVLLDICIRLKKKNHINVKGLLKKPIIGLLLSFSLWIFAIISMPFSFLFG